MIQLNIYIGKIDWQIFLNDYIYNVVKYNGKMFFRLYIYRLAKDDGKFFKIHKHNYRQLQLWIKWIKVWIKCG